MPQDILAQEDFSAGFFTGIAAERIPENGCSRIENGLIDEEGAIYKRGGATYKSNAGLGINGLTYLWDGFLDVGRRTVFANASDFGVLDSNDASPLNLGGDGLLSPRQSAVLASILFIGGGYLYGGSRKTASYSTGTVAVTNGSKIVTKAAGGFTANADAGMLFQIGNERVYVVASVDSDTQITLRDAYGGATNASVAFALHNIYKATTSDPYPISDFYAVCANRLLAADKNVVKFSGVNNPHSWGANDFHEVPEGERITGFGVIQQEAMLFTDQGVWNLSGLAFNIVSPNGDPQHKLALLSRDLILWHPAGITGWNQALVVPCVDSVWLLDATGPPVRLSRSIDHTYRDHVLLGNQPGQTALYRAHLFLPVITPSGNPRDCLVCRLDMPEGDEHGAVFPWTRLVGQSADVASFVVRSGEGVTNREPRLLAAERGSTSRILDCSTFFVPSDAVAKDPNVSTFSFIVETRAFATGNGTKNLVRHVRTRYDMLDTTAMLGPELVVFYSGGDQTVSNPKWDQVKWDQFNWGSEDLVWRMTGEDNHSTEMLEGLVQAQRRRLSSGNARLRHVRFRYVNTLPTATLFLRGVEVFVRPSRAVRI